MFAIDFNTGIPGPFQFISPNARAVFHTESWSWELHAWEPKHLGKEAQYREYYRVHNSGGGEIWGRGGKSQGPPPSV